MAITETIQNGLLSESVEMSYYKDEISEDRTIRLSSLVVAWGNKSFILIMLVFKVLQQTAAIVISGLAGS